jgi:hypothetical protein
LTVLAAVAGLLLVSGGTVFSVFSLLRLPRERSGGS